MYRGGIVRKTPKGSYFIYIQLENEKITSEKILDSSRKSSVEKLNKRIKKLEAETRLKQRQLDQVSYF